MEIVEAVPVGQNQPANPGPTGHPVQQCAQGAPLAGRPVTGPCVCAADDRNDPHWCGDSLDERSHRLCGRGEAGDG
ncbi:hypothetical protein [Streptomyces mirabilis]|uniref:hypothetical protein n=1 Tax=Streptomyces mirabilis TaxID=68239 RepID=UPI0037F82D56